MVRFEERKNHRVDPNQEAENNEICENFVIRLATKVASERQKKSNEITNPFDLSAITGLQDEAHFFPLKFGSCSRNLPPVSAGKILLPNRTQ